MSKQCSGMGQQWLHFEPDMVAVRLQASESFKGCRRDIFQQNAPPSPATAPLMRRGTVNSRFSFSLAKPRFLIRSLSVSLSLPMVSQFPVGLFCHSHWLHRLIKCPLKCPQMHSHFHPVKFWTHYRHAGYNDGLVRGAKVGQDAFSAWLFSMRRQMNIATQVTK